MVKEFKKKGISTENVYQSDTDGNHSIPALHENEFVILKSDQSAKKTLLGRISGGKVVPLVYKKSKPYGVSPRNVGQYFMQEALNFIRGRSISAEVLGTTFKLTVNGRKVL